MKHNFRAKKVISIGLLFIFTLLNGCKFDTVPEPIETNQTNSSNLTNFIHPGIVNTQASLNSITQLNDPSTARTSSYNNQVAAFNNQFVYSDVQAYLNALPTNATVMVRATGSVPLSVDPQQREGTMRQHSVLAYSYALAYVRTGQSYFADRAKFIINRWASKFGEFDYYKVHEDGKPDTQDEQMALQAAWVAPNFAAAAEIIRYYKIGGTQAPVGFSSTELTNLAAFFNTLNGYLNTYILVTGPLNVSGKFQNKYKSNWGTSAAYAQMAMGVYLESSTIYQSGYDYIKDLMPYVIANDGAMPEFCTTDCWHPQYTLTGLAYAAEIARIHSDNSIFEFNSRLMNKGFNYAADRYDGDADTCHECSTDTSDNGKHKEVYPGVELGYRYYNLSKIGTLRTEYVTHFGKADYNFFGFTTFTHYGVAL
ncbi:alginate lyase family protein [Adhaeribacter pallidiroseus]|uniref:Alginate lyase domain-containing protein n=1 Tax=Adhaeribacter pallidiroseus TaxID=2072847 RepID=A0A369QJQ6_9BACT|nr:alginate lyase family protein [Adhaeribacter pallidiroseus]RDC64622.1 hypothetical protein AHMF7616_03238 [Adhaeribacter pallidiroseus]